MSGKHIIDYINYGLFREHTKDCDLEEKEKQWRLLAYQILGI